MIQPLRQVHRVTFATLAALLPVVFVGSLAARRPIVIQESQSTRLDLVKPGARHVRVDARTLWANAVDVPDALIYWNQEPPAGDRLPVTALLLGSLQSARHAPIHMPEGKSGGYLLLYSLAWQKLAGSAPVPKEAP